MKFLKNIMLIILSYGCSTQADNDIPADMTVPIEIEHFNIMIVPDLSNRLDTRRHPRPLRDEDIVKVLLDNVYPGILNHRRSENQWDKFSIQLTNRQLIPQYNINAALLEIDFNKFGTQKERIEYIKGKTKSTFQTDTSAFMQEYRRLAQIAQESPFGADIWSFFNAGIDDTMVESRYQDITFDNKHYRNKFRNILILLTDGYVEADLYGKKGCLGSNLKQCYYLSSNRIQKFRSDYANSKIADIEDYFKGSGYEIVPAKNHALHDLEVLVLELYDRSLTTGGTASTHPTDMEIMKLFWSDWFTKSGTKRFEMRSVMGTTKDVQEVVMSFIGVR